MAIIGAFTGYLPEFSRPGTTVMGALALIVFGNILWRLLCETGILAFSIHEVLVSLDDQIKSLASTEKK